MPKFDGALNDNKLDYWTHKTKAYFKNQSTLIEANKILIPKVHMEYQASYGGTPKATI
jgi:hypothetical protein